VVITTPKKPEKFVSDLHADTCKNNYATTIIIKDLLEDIAFYLRG
jgi:hypothetical protein